MKRLIKKASMNTFYHGTNTKKLKSIISDGVIKCNSYDDDNNEVIYLANDEDMSINYSGTETQYLNGEYLIPVMIEVQLSDNELQEAFKSNIDDIGYWGEVMYPNEIPLSNISKITVYYDENHPYEMSSYTTEHLDFICEEIADLYEEDNEEDNEI